MNSEAMERFREAKQVAWDGDCERMKLRDSLPEELMRLAREIYMAGYCRGRIDEVIDAAGDDRWEPVGDN